LEWVDNHGRFEIRGSEQQMDRVSHLRFVMLFGIEMDRVLTEFIGPGQRGFCGLRCKNAGSREPKGHGNARQAQD
jgi:hypothetical protein